MKGVIVHGILLAVMLVVGYQTWTRDKSVAPELGSVEVWNRPVGDLVSVTFQSPRKKVVIAGSGWCRIATRARRRRLIVIRFAGVSWSATHDALALLLPSSFRLRPDLCARPGRH